MKKMEEGVLLALVMILVLCFECMLLVHAGSSHEEDYREYIEKLCEERNICPELVEAMIEKESGWNANAANGTCIGLMQIDQVIHWERMERLGVNDLFDPYDNILIGVDYLDELFHRYQDPAAVLMFYNAGCSDSCGLGAWLNGEMSSYAKAVLERSEELEGIRGEVPGRGT